MNHPAASGAARRGRVFMTLYECEVEKAAMEKLPWEKLDDKALLLSGATGMVGKCIIDVLLRRNREYGCKTKIIALSRDERKAFQRLSGYWEDPCFQYTACDVNNGVPFVGKADYIIHAASNTHPLSYATDPVGTICSNVIGTKNLLDYGAGHGTRRFCFLSSVEIYGENVMERERFLESDLGYIDCNTLRAGYPESKRLGEALCNAYQEAFDMDFVVARLSRIYGPTMLNTDTKAISQFIKKAAAGEDIVLKSDGQQKYSYTYVTDAVNAVFYTLLKGKSGEAYNVADQESDMTLRGLAQTLADIAGTQVAYERPGESEKKGYSRAAKAMLDAGRLKELGWRARVHMREGLSSVVSSMK